MQKTRIKFLQAATDILLDCESDRRQPSDAERKRFNDALRMATFQSNLAAAARRSRTRRSTQPKVTVQRPYVGQIVGR